LKGSGLGLNEVLYCYLPGGTEENQYKTSVRIAGDPNKIQTKHVLNTSIEHCLYIILFGDGCCKITEESKYMK
jgi:hypothetical protein